jgi:YggT family protein
LTRFQLLRYIWNLQSWWLAGGGRTPAAQYNRLFLPEVKMQVLWSSLYQLVGLVFQVYTFIVIGRVIISWVNPDPYNPIVRFLYNATEPLLQRLRRILPLQFSGIDLSPIALLIGLAVLENILLQLIARLHNGF